MSDRVELPTTGGGPGGERCETCRWWQVWDGPQIYSNPEKHADEPSAGTCRRHAPQPRSFTDPRANDSDLKTEWPNTAGDDWCGEWKAEPAAGATPTNAEPTPSMTWDEFLSRAPARMVSYLKHNPDINSWAEFARFATPPWRGCGDTTCNELFVLFREAGFRMPGEWRVGFSTHRWQWHLHNTAF